jgi:hypothetical protein
MTCRSHLEANAALPAVLLSSLFDTLVPYNPIRGAFVAESSPIQGGRFM